MEVDLKEKRERKEGKTHGRRGNFEIKLAKKQRFVSPHYHSLLERRSYSGTSRRKLYKKDSTYSCSSKGDKAKGPSKQPHSAHPIFQITGRDDRHGKH